MPNQKVLFVCNANRLRSPTAERIFQWRPGLEVKSAGVDKDATVRVSREIVEWADVIFVMEKRQRNIIHKKFKDIYQTKQIICLYIPDDYDLMHPDLIELLLERVRPYLNQ